MVKVLFSHFEAIVAVLLGKYDPETEGLKPIEIHKETIEKQQLTETEQSEETARAEGHSNWLRNILMRYNGTYFINYREPGKSPSDKTANKWTLNPDMDDNCKANVDHIKMKMEFLNYLLNRSTDVSYIRSDDAVEASEVANHEILVRISSDVDEIKRVLHIFED